MQTDDYAARLRAVVRLDELHSDLEPLEVLAAGRRAHRRRMARSAAGALCAALAVVLAAPAALEGLRRVEDTPPAARPEDFAVEVDTVTGTITLPLDRYFLTEGERRDRDRASAMAMRSCAADRGYDIPPTPDPGPDVSGDRRYGVWWLPSVEVFGYEVPTTPGDEQRLALNSSPDLAPTPEQMEVLEDCNATPEVRQFWYEARLDAPTPNFQEQVIASAAGQEVFADWEACLNRYGLRRAIGNGAPWAVDDGSEPHPSSDVATAVQDVRCKTEVDYVRRLATLEAQLQAPYIAAHRQELEAVRAGYEEALRRARFYIAEHG